MVGIDWGNLIIPEIWCYFNVNIPIYSKKLLEKSSVSTGYAGGKVETFTISGGKPTEVDMKLANGTKCIGEINGERLNGQARIEYSNGDKYDGKVANGMKSGQGIYIWVSGASYDGAWSDDQMSGCGTYTYPANENGYKLVGTFKGGLPDGECEYYVSASVHYQTTWLGGKCIKVTE